MGFHVFKNVSVGEKVRVFGEIFQHLNPEVQKVILTDLDDAPLLELLSLLKPDVLQYYPQTSSEQLAILRDKLLGVLPNLQIMKVVSAQSDERPPDVDRFLEAYAPVVDLFLLDTNLKGGTGRTHDWDQAREFISHSPRPVYLAGGLTVGNVQEAIRRCRPYGVDVETGISSTLSNGKRVKSIDKITQFIAQVRQSEGCT